MEIKKLKTFLLQKKGATEEYPFGPDTLVYKVGGKMFALMSSSDSPDSINLKCDPDDALALRAQYQAVQPGYHMNKKHWNTIAFDGSIPDEEIFQMINESYALVVKGLPKKLREQFQ